MTTENQISYMDELETLRVSSELFLNNLNQEDVLRIVCERAIQISQAHYCEIFIRDPADKELDSTLQRTTESISSQIQHSLQQTSAQLATQATQQQQIIKTTQEQANSDIISSWLVLPFKVGGNIMGAICLAHHQQETFSPYTTKLLSIFVDQASIAINNAQLFEDLTQAYTKLSHSRAEILENRNTLQTLFDGISDGLYIIDHKLNIIMVNQAEINHLNLSQEEIKTQSFTQLGWEAAAPEFIDLIKTTFTTGQKGHWISTEPSSPNPLIKNREMQIYPIVTPQNSGQQQVVGQQQDNGQQQVVGQQQDNVQQLIILAQDMTEQKQLRASLFQSVNLAAVGQLANSVAHEINNPLTIALTNTQLLLMDIDDDHEFYDLVQDIYKSSNRIKTIVANLVDLANQDEYIFAPLDVVETLEEALILIAHPLRKAKITVQRDYQVRPAVVASRSHLKLTWMNLLLNASDAIVATNKPGTITISIEQKAPDKIIVSINDTGIGIKQEHQEYIFRPFFTTKRTGKFVGLGLFTTHDIIEKHHGEICFDSDDKGTTFYVVLSKNGPPNP